MLENAYYSVISPESCAAIIWRDSGEAPLAAAALKLTAQDLLRLGLIDGIVPEPPDGAQANPEAAALALREVLLSALRKLSKKSPDELLAERYSKFRSMGSDLIDEMPSRPVSEVASL
jgi:acetyl-CoA carboxylase carboxyl transferase subunit alpha